MNKYNPNELEPKWQKQWAQDKLYEVTEDSERPKHYVLDMFPYPSGAGIHLGHTRNDSISDTYGRFQRMNGKNVLRPMGWDAFGLPAENYAIKTGISPQESTKQNTDNFREQLQRLGFAYDWSRELNTSDPSYYKWTQWLFLLLHKRGLAYKKESAVNWDPVDKTVLANEQVVNGKADRSGAVVEKKLLSQWFFKITDYADRLLIDLDELDWPEKIKAMQRNWIGRSAGAEIDFAIDGSDESIKIFTTRADTIFGATYMVLAPEHELVAKITTSNQQKDIDAYITETAAKTEIERMEADRPKTGAFTGAYAINPATKEKIPIWVADYVLAGYGTGAIMAVPAHDERDYAFAKAFDLPIVQVVQPISIDTVNPPKDGAKDTTRDVTMSVVYDPKQKKYLTLKWKKFPWHTFITGGIEEGEDMVEAAQREITEETGYKNLKLVGQLPFSINSHFYAAHKDVNRDITMNILQFELINNETTERELEDHESFDLAWVTKEELKDLQPVTELPMILRWLDEGDYVYTGEGRIIGSRSYDGQNSAEAREEMTTEFGSEKINYKMHDWLISRQRYWGAPIPIIHCAKCGEVAVPEKDLPVVLPELKSYEPAGDGKSPLARAEAWVKTSCPECGADAERETDTMDGFACSSWYFLRFADPDNDAEAWSAKKADYWLPVDTYVGGAEHAVMHLLYARFWTKVIKDEGLIDFDEPFQSLRNQGLILAEGGQKMSKSVGNVIDPIDVVNEGYGADAVRTYILFIAPYDQATSWNSSGIDGTKRFLNRVWALAQDHLKAEGVESSGGKALTAATHKTLKKVTRDLHEFGFNTAIAAMMELTNEMYKLKTTIPLGDPVWRENLTLLAQMLAPFAPHITEELWQQLGGEGSVHTSEWPAFDEELVVDETITVIVQVNGKLRAQLKVEADTHEDQIKMQAQSDENVARYTGGKEIVKTIYVPGKLVNFVVK